MTEPWRPSSLAVSAEELPQLFAKNRRVVIHFWAAWNAYDRHVDATLRTVRAQFEPQLTFRSVDLTSAEVSGVGLIEFAQSLPVLNVPALAWFIDGRLIEVVIGVRPEAELRMKFSEWLQRGAAAG
jgi:thioredoxin-like negative regulator of GroEL